MPFLKRNDPYAELRRLLKGYGMSGSRLARTIGKCENTARERLACPGRLTLDEIGMICRNGHIPADELREAIKFS